MWRPPFCGLPAAVARLCGFLAKKGKLIKNMGSYLATLRRLAGSQAGQGECLFQRLTPSMIGSPRGPAAFGEPLSAPAK